MDLRVPSTAQGHLNTDRQTEAGRQTDRKRETWRQTQTEGQTGRERGGEEEKRGCYCPNRS